MQNAASFKSSSAASKLYELEQTIIANQQISLVIVRLELDDQNLLCDEQQESILNSNQHLDPDRSAKHQEIKNLLIKNKLISSHHHHRQHQNQNQHQNSTKNRANIIIDKSIVISDSDKFESNFSIHPFSFDCKFWIFLFWIHFFFNFCFDFRFKNE